MKIFKPKILIILACCWVHVFLCPAQKASDYFHQGEIALTSGRYGEALTNINKAISSDSSDAGYYLLRARINLALAQYNKCIEDCYLIQSRYPNMPEVYFLRGQICMVTESYGCALLLFGKAIDGFTGNDQLFRAYLSRGKVYEASGEYSKALDDFSMAAELFPDSVSILMPLADIYIKMKKADDAKMILDRITGAGEDYAPAFRLYGELYFMDTQYPEAVAMFGKYLQLHQGDVAVINQIALSYIMMKEYEKAKLIINRSLTLDVNNPETHKLRGIAYLSSDNKEEGCNSLFRAMLLGYLEKVGYDLLDIYIANCEE